MKNIKNCKYCGELFDPRRRNHLYCTSSCKTMASYKRNGYNYMSGHYQKAEIVKKENLPTPLAQKVEKSITTLEERVHKMDGVNVSSVTNAALGSLAASTAINGAKHLFAPKSLPASKGDIESLKKEIELLRLMLKKHQWPFSQ